MSNTEWYIKKIIWTVYSAIFYGFCISLVIGTFKIGQIVKGQADDLIILCLVVVISIYLGWKSSSSIVENFRSLNGCRDDR